MAELTTDEKETLAAELMISQKLKPKKAMQEAGLDYKYGSTGYHRVFGIKRRRLCALEKCKAQVKVKKLTATLKTHEQRKESLQQYRHETNRATRKLEDAFAEIRALQKANEALRKETETWKKR